jgi:hypothetical protein
MIELINLEVAKGIVLFNRIRFCLTIDKGLYVNSYGIMVKLFAIEFAFIVGKEVKNGKKSRQKIKESKNTYASA